MTLLDRLAAVAKIERGLDAASAAEATREVVEQVPALTREAAYLDLLRATGGLHVHRGNHFSFGIFGFDEPGYGITSLYEGELHDGPYFRFADVIAKGFDENIVFAFDLRGTDRRVFSTPGGESTYAPYARDFEELLERIIEMARHAE